jgi:Mg/Co/Ni transporter MgtE
MSGRSELAAAYLRLHPEGAARLLEALPAEQAKTVLAAVDADTAAPVLGRMLPHYAAQCIADQPAAETAPLFERLGSREAVAVLRQLDLAARERVFEGLGAQWLVAFRLRLSYPVNTVGAWLEPHVLTLPDDCTAGDARDRVARSAAAAQPRIYVLDRARRLRGAVRAVALLQTPSRKSLATIVEPTETLWTREPLATALESPLWERDAEAPVLNRAEEFVGTISYADLRRAQRQLTSQDDPRERELAEVTELITVGAGTLWRSLGDLVGGEKRR